MNTVMANDSAPALAATTAVPLDPVEARLARMIRRLADENRTVLALMRCGWSLEEAGRAAAAAAGERRLCLW
jgi:hypothetical protein